MRRLLLVLLISVCAKARTAELAFQATAFSTHGITNAGSITRRGIVAADPRVLPLGSVIRVSLAGVYSGEYVVEDTGSRVRGRHIDIYVPSTPAARRFGKKVVLVSVVHWGAGKPARRPS